MRLKRTSRTKPIRIALFNHKGGVGKTTLTVNLAFALASLDKTVLLVDSDPQCNLTSYLVPAKVVNRWLDESEGKKGNTLWSGLRPLVQAGHDVVSVEPFKRAKGVYLLPGDIKLSDYELELQQAWTDCLQRKIKGFMATTALCRIVDETAEAIDADFIFYDVGPNIGPLNRAILMDCEHFIVPAACDYFSTRALTTLGRSIANWVRDWDVIAQLAPNDVPILSGRPVYLGYVLQRFRMYGGDISSAYREYAKQLERHSYSDIVAVLREVDEKLAPGSLSQFKLGQIKDFGTLASDAQRQSVALCNVDGGAQYLKDQAKTAFEEFAHKVIARIKGT